MKPHRPLNFDLRLSRLACKLDARWQWANCKTAKHHGSLVEFCIMALVIFRTRKDQNKSKFKEKIQHYRFDLTFYGICTSCFIFQLSI